MDETQRRNEQRRNAASELITTGHIRSAVWYLAWPTAISTLIQTAYAIINAVFVGRLPDATSALAAVGIGNTVLMVQFGIVIALSTGTAALVARFLGAQQHGDADEATRQSLLLCVVGGVASGLPLIAFAAPAVRMIGAQEDVIPLAAEYTAIIAWSSVPMFFYMIITTALRSAGDVRSPLYAGALIITINVLLDWLLIFGIGPFPRMGVQGAAVATGLSRVAGMGLMFWFLSKSVLRGAMIHFRPHFGWFRRILNIGWPAAVQNLLWTTAQAGFLRVLGLLPGDEATAAQAALTVALRIEAISFMPGVAYAMAATPLVGQNLGAGKPDRAAQSAWVATGQAAFVMTLVAVLFFTVPRWLALRFTTEAAVVSLIVSYLRINAISQPFLAVNMVLRGALQGAGETRAPAWIVFITTWLIRLPLAWGLSIGLGYGAVGAWIAMSATTILAGMLVSAWFIRGTWRTTQV